MSAMLAAGKTNSLGARRALTSRTAAPFRSPIPSLSDRPADLGLDALQPGSWPESSRPSRRQCGDSGICHSAGWRDGKPPTADAVVSKESHARRLSVPSLTPLPDVNAAHRRAEPPLVIVLKAPTTRLPVSRLVLLTRVILRTGAGHVAVQLFP
jgi:hypothetical protein